MRKHYNINNLLFLTLLSAVTACSSEDNFRILTSRTPIQLTVGVEGPKSRAAVITDETTGMSTFGSTTGIWMVMQSDYKSLGNDKDYQGSQATKYCVTYGTTGTAQDNVNPVSITGDNIRYWDDIHARSSALSVWALAVPGKTGALSATDTWKSASGWGGVSPSKTIEWAVATNQDATTMANNDLCFSNNIADYTGQSDTDRRMKFNPETSKFAEGKLVFYHALTKITVKLIEDEGFDHSSTSDFNLLVNKVTLKGNKLSGTFDVADGAFASTADAAAATTMSCGTKTAEGYTLEALVLPGTNLSTALTDAVSFSIDGNRFAVSNATLLTKLRENHAVPDTWTTMEAGKNYIFTFNIKKTAINVTATVKDWENLEGTNYSPLINISQSYGNEGNNFGKGFSLYLSKNTGEEASLDDDFSKGTDVTYADNKYTLNTPLYWPNHQKHYLFRGVWPTVGESGTPSGKVTAKSIAVANVKYVAETYPSDLMLGYPRKANEICPHDKKVEEKGICATSGDIRMNFEYMMSQVEVNLSTNDGATNTVVFDSNTKVEIVGGYREGVILFKNGIADFTDKAKADYTMSKEGDTHKKFRDAIIPQLLDGLVFRITVTDTDGKRDQYETVLGIKDIEVQTAGGTKTKVYAWEPGKKYVYNLYITKTDIKVTATITDWITATGSTNIWM